MTGPVWPDLLTVQVTAQDISEGKQKSCLWCPVAIASARALSLGDGRFVTVLPSAITIYERHLNARVATWRPPESVARFINDFDSDHPVEPFTFAAERSS
jgi:hypothetical protein